MSLALSTTPLPDDAARARIAGDLGATLFVEAGAGTGKTAALVGRVVGLVRSGVCALREIAAITFTEAAASELRERLRLAIDDAAGAETGNVALARARREVDEAAISTIHGFCQRILAEHPLDAGLPLRFEVLDDVAAAIAFDQRFSTFLDRLYDEEDARVLLAAASCLQISPAQLRLIALQLDERVTMEGEGPAGGLAAGIEERAMAAARGLARAMDAALVFGASCRDGEDGLGLRLAELAVLRQRFDDVSDWMDALRWMSEMTLRRAGNTGRRENWPEGEIEACRETLGALFDLRDRALRELADLVLSRLISRLAIEARRAAAERRRQGTLIFQDLLVTTEELLRRSPEVRGAVRSRFARILVDEFQDTDPLQLRIVSELGSATPPATEGRLFPLAAEPEAGRLFFVGDPKQSIYRFRGADVDAYLAAQQSLERSETLRLTANFRSVPGVLDWVNTVFAALLGDGAAAYPFLQAVRPPHAGAGSVRTIGGPSAVPMTQAERRRTESEDVAEVVRRAVGEGWPVTEGEATRPARFGDVAILLPRRTGLFTLERELEEREIPYQVASSTLVYGSTEVRDLCAALAALAPGADERAIVAALRTPAFACSDDEILAWRLAGGLFRLGEARRPEDAAGAPVAAALAALSELHAESYRLGVVGTLDRLIRERRVVALQASAPRMREALRRVDFVLDRARVFSDGGGNDLAAFLSFLDLEARLGVRSIELGSSDNGEDLVKILTVHGAKGLEFPIVVLAELGGPITRTTPGPRVLVDGQGGLEVRVRSGIETAGFATLAKDEDEAEIAEALRVAYVGATRARDHLVVALHHQPARTETARSIAERIAEVAPKIDDAVPRERSSTAFSSLTRDLAPPAIALDEWRRARAILLAQLARPTSVTATSLVGAYEAHPRARTASDPVEWREPRAATNLGRAVHRVLQLADLVGARDLAALSAAAAAEEGHLELAEVAEGLARAALVSPVVRRAAVSAHRWRELPLTLALGDGVLEAVVDLCFEDERGRFVVVDYKTDALSTIEEVASAAARYRVQVGAYALALQGLLGRAVDEAVLLFVALPGGAIEHRVEDLSAAAAEAGRRAAAGLAVFGSTMAT